MLARDAKENEKVLGSYPEKNRLRPGLEEA